MHARSALIIPCDLCGSQENLQRQKVKEMLQGWEREQPGRINNIFRAITNVEPSHLADTNLYDFKNLSQQKPRMKIRCLEISPIKVLR